MRKACLLLCSLICFYLSIIITSVARSELAWVQQGNEATVEKYRKMLNQSCKIERILLDDEGRPNRSITSRQLNVVGDVEYDNGSMSDSNDNSSRQFFANANRKTAQTVIRQSESSGNGVENFYKPITDIVIDPCQDEENRSFMECVLIYKPNIDKTDSLYNNGTCMCYRDWSADSLRVPAYNHEYDYKTMSTEWFVWNKKLKECVIKTRKRCAPRGKLIVPYHCEPVKHPETKLESEGRCVDVETDPNFMICVGEADIVTLTSPAFLWATLLITQFA